MYYSDKEEKMWSKKLMKHTKILFDWRRTDNLNDSDEETESSSKSESSSIDSHSHEFSSFKYNW